MGGELLTRCDELWVMGSAIFSGMREEMELAKKLYMPIFYVSDEMILDRVGIALYPIVLAETAVKSGFPDLV